tara:strand:- start:1077 stop:1199 length:123 start_codon:yes stop_codon:yes gene_type:complete
MLERYKIRLEQLLNGDAELYDGETDAIEYIIEKSKETTCN